MLAAPAPPSEAPARFPELQRLRERQRQAGRLPEGLLPAQLGLAEPQTLHDVHKVQTHRKGGFSYRVRLCKLCTHEASRLELGTFATLESALLVCDGYKLLIGSTEHLHVLVPGDEQWFNSLVIQKHERRSCNQFSLDEVLDACRSPESPESSDSESLVIKYRTRARQTHPPPRDVHQPRARRRVGATLVIIRPPNRPKEDNMQVVHRHLRDIHSAHLKMLGSGLADHEDMTDILQRVIYERQKVPVACVVVGAKPVVISTNPTLLHSIYAVFARAILAAARELDPERDWDIIRLIAQRHSLRRRPESGFYEFDDPTLIPELELFVQLCKRLPEEPAEAKLLGNLSPKEHLENLLRRADALVVSTFVANYSYYTEAIYPFEGDTDYFDVDPQELVEEARGFVPEICIRQRQLLQLFEKLPDLCEIDENIERVVLLRRIRLEMVLISHMFLLSFFACRAGDVDEEPDWSREHIMPCWTNYFAILGRNRERSALGPEESRRYLREAMISYLVQKLWLIDTQPEGARRGLDEAELTRQRILLDAAVLGSIEDRYAQFGQVRCIINHQRPGLWVFLGKELEGIATLLQYFAYRSWINHGHAGPASARGGGNSRSSNIGSTPRDEDLRSRLPMMLGEEEIQAATEDLDKYYRQMCVKYPHVQLHTVLEDCLELLRALIDELDRNWSIISLGPGHRALFLIATIARYSVHEFVPESMVREVVAACNRLCMINTQRSKYAIMMGRAMESGEFQYPPKWPTPPRYTPAPTSASLDRTDSSADDLPDMSLPLHPDPPIDIPFFDSSLIQDDFYNLFSGCDQLDNLLNI